MKIDSYSIGMESERLYKSYSATRKYASVNEGSASTGSPLSSFTDMLGDYEACEEEKKGEKEGPQNLKDATEKAMRDLSLRSPVNARPLTRSNVSDQFQRLHELMIRHILDLLFGRHGKNVSEEQDVSSSSPFVETRITRNYTETTFHEEESVAFNTSGKVKTSDGREIDINLNIGMSRSFEAFYSEFSEQQIMRVCDPLVINLDDAPASLSDMKFYFDLDADGSAEEISRLNSGSGYLALDKNEDGIINDGSELFGTSSGDGFKDLAAYDKDNNGWIDENDEIFDKLKIWVTDSDGNSALYSLKDKNVGAIYLGSASTQYSLNSVLDNTTKGYVRQTGIFLYEDGQAGTVQHVDLVS